MSKIAIIPARGGSKRLPGKNIKRFHGRPVIAYAIDAANQAALFDSVVVATDCADIAQVARQYGAEVPFLRDAENADDNASMALALKETLDKLTRLDRHYDSICCLFATGPFVTPALINEGYQLLQDSSTDSVVTVQKNAHPIMRSLTLSDNGKLEMLWKDQLRTRSQDLSTTYHDAAQMYWAKTEKFMEQGTFYTSRAVPLVLGEMDCHDIDTPEDWAIAEQLWSFNHLHRIVA